MLFLLILTLIGSDSRVDVPAGVLASPELCHMAARGVIETYAEQGSPDVAMAYRCVPQGAPA